MSAVDAIGLLVVAACLLIIGIATLVVPRVLSFGRKVALAALFIYFQLSLLFALFMHQGQVDQFSLNRLAQLMALLYLASFALLVRRALLLPLLHGIAIAAQGTVALSQESVRLSLDGKQIIQLIVVTQPLYLALLAWINLQRQQGISAQREALNAKMTSLGMISHELRSPLQTIIGAIEALERRFEAWSLPRKEYKNLGRIRFSAAQLDSYLSDLIVMTKQGTGLSDPKSDVISLEWMLQDMMRSYDAAASDRGNALELVVAEGCEHVMGDKVRVHQIVNNLVSNAVKYTSDGDVKVQVVRPSPVEDWIHIVVMDTGIGILPDKLDLIWRPYVRLQQDASGAKGNGLGLAVVQLLVELLGGFVSVSSKPGKGTTFTVKLRLPPATEA